MYCVKCKKQTKTKDEYKTKTSNGKDILKGVCVECGTTKNKFLPKRTQKCNCEK